MEDNSTVVTMTNSDSVYTKICKHFLMVLNYIKEQIALGQIEARKIYRKLNTADMHAKPLRSTKFLAIAHKILGHPHHHRLLLHWTQANLPLPLSLPRKQCHIYSDMGVEGQPSTETKRSLQPDPATTTNAKRRKTHILRYITRPASDSPMRADVDVPAI